MHCSPVSLSRLLLSLVLLCCLALWACGGGSSTPPTQTPPPQSTPEIFYGTGPQGISSYSVDASTGKLTLLSSVTGAGSNFTDNLVAASSGKYVFAPENLTPGIEVFSVSSNGSVSEIAGSPFSMPGFIVGGVAIDPAGKFLFSTDPAFDRITPYTIGTTGTLTISNATFSTGPVGSSPKGVATDPSSKFLYAANQGGNSIAAFTIDSTTGNLTAISGSPFATSVGMPIPIVMHPSGNFLYTGLTQVGGIDGFSINGQTGALTKMSGSPFLPQPLPCVASCSLALTPSGKFLYTVTNKNNGDAVISAYAVDSTTGVLTQVQGSPFATPPPPSPQSGKSPCGPQNPAYVDLSGTLLYVSCANPAVMVFSINPSTGAVTPVTGDPNSNFGTATFPTNGANSAITLGRVP